MAIKMIKLSKKFVDSMNEDGPCPLSILASKPVSALPLGRVFLLLLLVLGWPASKDLCVIANGLGIQGYSSYFRILGLALKILGAGMSIKKWEAVLKHAKKCKVANNVAQELGSSRRSNKEL